MSKLQQDFWHPLFYFIRKDGLSTYDTTATPSDALPHNTNQTGLCRTEMNLPQRCITHAGHFNGKRFFISPISFQFFHKCTDRSYQSTVHRQRRIPVSKHLLLYGL